LHSYLDPDHISKTLISPYNYLDNCGLVAFVRCIENEQDGKHRQPSARTAATGSLMFKALIDVTYRQARRLVIFVVGMSMVLVGVAMIFLPGPAVIVIPAGLAVLSLEFAWAKRFLRRVRQGISEKQRQMRLRDRD
jgi:hypothetical protein